MRRPDAVLFDLDDTLVDRSASIRRFASALGAAYATRLAAIEVDHLAKLIAHADQVSGRLAPNRSGFDRHDLEVAEELARLLPWEGDAPAPEEIADYWTETFPTCAVASPGLEETLAWLRARDVKLGIVTNGVVARQIPKIEAIGLSDLAVRTIVSEAVGIAKPDRRIFELGLAAVGTPASRAWFVGDNPTNDVLGAAAVGLTAVWYRRQIVWPADKQACDLAIGKLPELIRLLD